MKTGRAGVSIFRRHKIVTDITYNKYFTNDEFNIKSDCVTDVSHLSSHTNTQECRSNMKCSVYCSRYNVVFNTILAICLWNVNVEVKLMLMGIPHNIFMVLIRIIISYRNPVMA